jgi:hypothetical protein
MATAPTTAGAPGMAPPAAADRVGPEYADLAAFFDRFAPDEARCGAGTAPTTVSSPR